MKNPQRTVYIFGHIDTNTLSSIPVLRDLDETKGQIDIVISSPGGEDYVGYALFDCIKSLKNKVVIYGIGEVCSIATIIFLASQERFLSKNCELMIHNGSVVMQGHTNVDDVSRLAGQVEQNNEKYYKVIHQETGIPVSMIRKWACEEKFFSASEAVAEGFAKNVR